MTDMGMPYEFYEDDEPIEELLSAYEDGEHGVTRPPVLVETSGLAVQGSRTFTYQAKVSVEQAIAVSKPVVVRGVA